MYVFQTIYVFNRVFYTIFFFLWWGFPFFLFVVDWFFALGYSHMAFVGVKILFSRFFSFQANNKGYREIANTLLRITE